MPQRNTKANPISMRLPDDDVAVIDRAAGLTGRSRTDFMREAAVKAAEAVILDETLLRMGPEAFDHFAASVSAPPAPVKEMVDVFAREAPWEAGSDQR